MFAGDTALAHKTEEDTMLGVLAMIVLALTAALGIAEAVFTGRENRSKHGADGAPR
jgi:hypothetical protein